MGLFCQGVKTVVENGGYLGLAIDPSILIGTHNKCFIHRPATVLGKDNIYSRLAARKI